MILLLKVISACVVATGAKCHPNADPADQSPPLASSLYSCIFIF